MKRNFPVALPNGQVLFYESSESADSVAALYDGSALESASIADSHTVEAELVEAELAALVEAELAALADLAVLVECRRAEETERVEAELRAEVAAADAEAAEAAQYVKDAETPQGAPPADEVQGKSTEGQEEPAPPVAPKPKRQRKR